MATITFTRLLHISFLTCLMLFFQAGHSYAAPPADAIPVSVTGQLSVQILDDFENKRSELQYFIEDKQSKKQYRLQFNGTPPKHLHTGMRVTANGKAKGNELLLAADGISSPSGETLLPATTMVAGDQKTLVMVGNFNDVSVSCTTDEIRDIMFTDPANNHVDTLYQEMSHGAVSFSGNVSGPYNIDYSSTDSVCDTAGWANALDSAAASQGIDLSTYAHKVYVLPSQNPCGFTGLGSLGGHPSQAWIMRCSISGIYSHELGHNLGMNHASTPTNQYGDSSDTMGSSVDTLRKINAPHQEQMGWVPAYQVTEVTQSGTYDIAPLASDPAQALAPQMLKIRKPDTSDYYYLSYRQPLGFDKNIASSYHNSLNIHTYTGDGSANRTFLLGKLQDGEILTDADNTLQFSQLSHNSDYVTVQIDMNDSAPTPVCTAGTSQLDLSPSSQSGESGETLYYTVMLTNTDNSACSSTSFDLNPNIPAGWTASFSPSTLTLEPGATASATLAVTSPASSVASTYPVGASVSDSGNTVHSASASASYTVVQSCTAAAPGINLLPGSQNGDAGSSLEYTISLINNDSGDCNASTFDLTATSLPNDWTSSLSTRTLSLSAGEVGTATLYVTSAVTAIPGSYIIQLGISDAQAIHDSSETVTYVVNDLTPAQDTVAPTTPTGLTASADTVQVSLSWYASTDNVAVAGYEVLRNGIVIANTSTTNYSDTSGADGVSYVYSIIAYDAAGNFSAESNSVTAGKAKAKGKGKDKGGSSDDGSTTGSGNNGKGKGSTK